MKERKWTKKKKENSKSDKNPKRKDDNRWQTQHTHNIHVLILFFIFHVCIIQNFSTGRKNNGRQRFVCLEKTIQILLFIVLPDFPDLHNHHIFFYSLLSFFSKQIQTNKQTNILDKLIKKIEILFFCWFKLSNENSHSILFIEYSDLL